MANPINLGTIVDQSTGISTAWGQGINDWVYGAYGVLGATFSAGAFRAALGASAPADIQAQTATAFTTGGTSTAFTLTPSPAITSLVAGQRFRVKFNATAGADPTLAISGLAATALKLYDSTGAKVAASSTSIVANMLTDVEYDGTDMVILDPLPPASGVASFNTRTGAVALTSADVTNALAFTPAVNTHNHSGVYVAVDSGHNNVGSFVYARKDGSTDGGAGVTAGTTYAGSSLSAASIKDASGTISVQYSGTLSGTWRALGYSAGYSVSITLYQRIS